MTTGPFSSPPIHGSLEVRRAFDGIVGILNQEGVSGYSYMVPLYDPSEEIHLIADEQSAAGPTNVTASTPNWQTLLTASLKLEKDAFYRIYGTASADMNLDAGSAWETIAVRVNDGTTTLHTLYASSEAPAQYVPVTVPFTQEIQTTSAFQQIDYTMDVHIAATSGGGPPVMNRMRLIVLAIPVYLESGG